MNAPTGIQYRTFAIAKPANAEEEDIALCCSSEEPVERSFGTEVLDHSPESVDMSRMTNGAPLLVNHNPDDQVGVVTAAAVTSDRKMRATVKFSRSARGREIRQDVLDGIRTMVSIGYQITKGQLEKRDGQEIYRVTSWCPMETSLVAIPADKTVGVGRSASPNTGTQQTPNTVKPMSDTPKVEVQDASAEIAAWRKRTAEILAIGKEFGMADAAHDFVSNGKTVDEFRDHVLRTKFKAQPVKESAAEIGMNKREAGSFSIAKAIREISEGKGLSGLEREASAAAQALYKRETGPLGFTIPHDVMKRDMTAGTSNQGGYSVPTGVGSLVELLRNKMVTAQAGVQQMGGLTGNITLPTHTGTGTAYWLAETANITESSQTLGQIAPTPKRLGAYSEYSKQLLIQSSLDVESFIRNDLATVLALAIDDAVLEGSGGGGQPTGVLNWSGKATDITFGGAPVWQDIVDFETNIATANGDVGSMNFITTPAVVGKWKTTLKAAGTSATFLIENNQANGYPVLRTNQVASDLVLFGVWNQAMLLQWGGQDVIVDPYGSQALAGLVRIVTQMFVDVAVRQPKAFCVSTDAGKQ